ncbi:hypothetical protein [Uliginosibacterium gangwonense]|uniref:hypothetical protein n=1 Tax=Uliginosibacterium gangwonense TaxID=392736 RepID=UPI00037FECF1|nr:hypothetical protein [Uliginosibacterium gangwonense]
MTIPSGCFVQIDGERFYAIKDVDRMPPFFMSLVSSSDLWMFLSSTGGLTAGRVQPEKAIFPYVPVDQIHISATHTGSRTLIRVLTDSGRQDWEPFNADQSDKYQICRTLYKDEMGARVIFEEENQSLQLRFSYSWAAAGDYGFVRTAWVESLAGAMKLEILDGIQNLLPSGTPRALQSSSSNLVDAYKWNELDASTGLAMYALYAQISDRAEPSESLEATCAFGLGLEGAQIRLAASDFAAIRAGDEVAESLIRRGVRGAYFLQSAVDLQAGQRCSWQIVVDTAKTQADVVALRQKLNDRKAVAANVARALAEDRAGLCDLLARADAFQCVADPSLSVHHTANVLFNIMRGGVFPDQYQIDLDDFLSNLALRNHAISLKYSSVMKALSNRLSLAELENTVRAQGDAQLQRLLMEYLPLAFSRRHGDPSRPWNHFAIRLKDEAGHRRLAYQGNWRDIFQNWEALLLSYPAYAEHVIAKFVNASTLDGYNPYRISQDGIDWEEDDPEDPWSNIGYWGDHQINYLLRLLELCQRHYPSRLRELLGQAVFCYANVPYRIADFASQLRDSKATVRYDHALADRIAKRCDSMGSDGRLIQAGEGEVYLVGLAEKLFVPLLAKLGNLVPGGGIWMNTQRPEWNDANNALVGTGLSMVTLCYMRRYVTCLQELLGGVSESFAFTAEIAAWVKTSAEALKTAQQHIKTGCWDQAAQYALFQALGHASSDYRARIYSAETFAERTTLASEELQGLLDAALQVLDVSIRANRRDDGLYHAYNLLLSTEGSLQVGHLYPMLEGQVAVLSSGVLSSQEALNLLEALFASPMYREDQASFMLYPDEAGSSFLTKNRIPEDRVLAIPVFKQMLQQADKRLILQDAEGIYRFAASVDNAKAMQPVLAALAKDYQDLDAATCQAIEALYEDVFQHKRFTGRSGTMFGFEGRGCIYWHMVSKLLLAAQEVFFAAHAQGEDPAIQHKLGEMYYRIRKGIGFNKSPSEYGAFPCDPYSHTPGHAGAQQPGMTGQVKEEVITRQAELGLSVMNGSVFINPALLDVNEFQSEPAVLRYLDTFEQWQELAVEPGSLAFTWYQVPFVIRRSETADAIQVTLKHHDGSQQPLFGAVIPSEASQALFAHAGKLRAVAVEVPSFTCFRKLA